MSFKNFIPTVHSAYIETKRKENCVAAELSWKEFEGDIKGVGDSVKIVGVGRVTVDKFIPGTTIINPERPQDASTIITVDQADYFSFLVEDIDAAQAKGNVMNAQSEEASRSLALSSDQFIYQRTYKDAGKVINATGITSANVISKIVEGLTALWGADVPNTEEVSLEVSPPMAGKLMLANLIVNTNNTGTVQNGLAGTLAGFLGVKVYVTNNLYNDGTFDYCYLRTKKAVAFVNNYSKMEAYRPENGFSDALKGLHVYTAKTIRPAELVVIKASYGAETII